MFTQEDFKRLAKVDNQICLSMYIPTHRYGEQTHNKHDAIVLKDALNDAESQLAKQTDLEQGQIDSMLEPLSKLIEDEHFWRHQSDALAIFANAEMHETFSLPIPMSQPSVHVGKQFSLKIASRILAPASRWYVYAVTQGENQFFECTRKTITNIYIDDLVPKDMEEVLEVYEGGETLQHHGKSRQQAGGGGSVYTGQGSNEDRRDEQLEILFRRLGNGITKLIAGEKEPLVLVADEQYISQIKASIDYPHIIDQSVNTNPAVLDPLAIQRETWEIVQPIFDRNVEELQKQFISANGGGSLANGLADVTRAAHNGQVAALYVAEEANGRMGTFDTSTNRVEFSSADTSTDLLEKVIRDTVSHDGQVMFRLGDEVPDKTDGVTAVLRYDY